MTVTTTRIIPGNSDIISISGNQIKVSKTSVFEVTLCGRISGVTNDTGGKFYLYNATTNEKISDMEFVLDKGLLLVTWIFQKLILLMFMLVVILK